MSSTTQPVKSDILLSVLLPANEQAVVFEESRYAHGKLHGRQMEIRNGVQEYSSYTNGEKDLAREHIVRYPDGKNKEKGAFDEKNQKTGK